MPVIEGSLPPPIGVLFVSFFLQAQKGLHPCGGKRIMMWDVAFEAIP
jgi:hypothetical protein